MTIRKTRFPNRIFYFCIRVRYAYNRLYTHFNRLLSFFNLSKYLNTICWWNGKHPEMTNEFQTIYSNDIFVLKISTRNREKFDEKTLKLRQFLLPSKNFRNRRRWRREKEREKSEKERETSILSPTFRIELSEEIGFIFDEKGLFSLFKLHHHH